MLYHTDISKLEEIRVTNGTTDASDFNIHTDETVVIIDVTMFGGEIFFEMTPQQPPIQEPTQLRSNVIAGLERSLQDNADIWAELSKL